MVVRLGEIMRETASASLRSDVQIAQYWTPHNLDLLRNYIFTAVAPGQKKSSIDLLERFTASLQPGGLENRFVVIATYGHGKSHFGLALANFFGKPYASEEAKVVLERVKQALPEDEAARFRHLEDFRRGRKPYLILILRGDEPSELRQKFYRAVKEALAAGPGGAEAPLPFWLQDAERLLLKIRPEDQARANAYLARFQLDLPTLLQQVRDAQPSTHDICIGLARELYDVSPELGTGLSLKEAIKRLLDEQCGDGKPYEGVLVLFDEFSTFVAEYTHKQLPGAPLQDLLNGISDAPERAAFIAFAQHDPNDVARRYSQGDVQENVLRELGRLPQNRRYELHSSLEEVLDSYLRKKGEVWAQLLRDVPSFPQQLDIAATDALLVFRQRYRDDMGWELNHFDTVVTRGCYPLHPLTTCILCSVELQTVPDPRSVLGFVRREVDERPDQPVATADGPYFVRAIALVDYFRDMLGSEPWQRYRDALGQINPTDEPIEADVLKAMLVQTAARMSTEPIGYDKAIAELAGRSHKTASQVLNGLSQRGIIQKDAAKATYRLPPVGWGKGGDKLIQDKVQALILSAETFEPLRLELAEFGFGPMPMTVAWGHRDDWQVEQAVVVREMLTAPYLKGLVERRVTWSVNGEARDKARGVAVWAIAEREDDVAWYDHGLPELFRQAFGEKALPVIVMRPPRVSATLVDRLKRYLAIKGFSEAEKRQVGQDWHRQVLDQARLDLRDAAADFRGECRHATPAAFRAQLSRLADPSLPVLLDEVIAMAYPRGPKQWFDQYKLSQNAFSTAAGVVTSWLMESSRLDPAKVAATRIERDIVGVLRNHWRVLDANNRVVPPPDGTALHPSWTALDRALEPGSGSQPTKAVLEQLLNPPYGFDWNTLAILFAAWRSYHRHDAVIEYNGCRLPSGAPPKPSVFVQTAGRWYVGRVDVAAQLREVEALADEVRSNGQFTREDAQTKLEKLHDPAGIDDNPGLREKLKEARARLEDGLRHAREYDAAAQSILQEAEKSDLAAVLGCLSRIQGLPSLSVVLPRQPTADEIRFTVDNRIGQVVASTCITLSRLAKLEDYTSSLDRLNSVRTRLQRAGRSDLLSEVDDAIAKLGQERDRLRGRVEKEAERRTQQGLIRNISLAGGLSDLERAQASLDILNPLPELKAECERKRDAVIEEIGRLQSFASSLPERMDQAANQQSVGRLRDEAMQIRGRFDDEELRPAIDAALGRCNILLGYFGALNELQRRARGSPEEFRRDVDQANQLIAGNATALSPAQRAVGERLVTALQAGLANEQQEATHLLDRLVAGLVGGVPPPKVRQDADNASAAWAFLLGADQDRLNQLRRDIQDRIERERRERDEAERRQAEIRRLADIVRAVPEKGAVSLLHQGLARLDELDPPSEVRAAWEKKRSAVIAELSRLTELPDALAQELDRAMDRQAVNDVRAKANRAQPLCDEDEQLAKLEQILARADALGSYFEQVDSIRQQTRATRTDFVRGLGALRLLLGEGSGALTDGQRGVAERAIADLDDERAALERTASERLATLRQKLESGARAATVQAELDATSGAFLTVEDSAGLERLRHDIQATIDADVVQQVERLFRQISSPSEQKRCLEALRHLIGERV